MKRPDITNAIRIFYVHSELGNKEIRELFGDMSSSTIVRLKKDAKKVMIEKNAKTNSPYAVDTVCAYEAWGINIDSYEKRARKLMSLKALGIL